MTMNFWNLIVKIAILNVGINLHQKVEYLFCYSVLLKVKTCVVCKQQTCEDLMQSLGISVGDYCEK